MAIFNSKLLVYQRVDEHIPQWTSGRSVIHRLPVIHHSVRT